MKTLIKYLISGLLMVNVTVQAKSTEEPLDQVVAIVNDDVISRSELDHAINNARMMLTSEHTSSPSSSILQKQVLDQLINKKLQLQIAKQSGIDVTDKDLNAAIHRIAESNHISIEELFDHINQDGMSTSEYKHEIHDQMTMQRLQQQEVASKISVSDDEIANFIRSRSWQMNATSEYHLQDILIPLSDTPSSDDVTTAKKRADAVLTKLNKGLSFDAAAQAESGGSQALQGGDLGWRKLPEIPSAFAEQVASMKPNQIVGPIQTPNGFHIIRLAEVRQVKGKDNAPSRKQIETMLLQQKFEEAVQNWSSKLRGQAFVVTKLS